MDTKMLLGLICRHTLGAIGAWLVGQHLLAENNVDQFVGAGMVLAAIAWSAYQKWGKVFVDKMLAQSKGIAPVLLAAVAITMMLAASAQAQPKLPQFKATGNLSADMAANNAALMTQFSDLQTKLDALSAKLPQVTGNPTKDIAANNATFDSALSALDLILQPDIDAAAKAADAAGNFGAKNCMEAISGLVKANAAANTAAAELSATPATLPAAGSPADIAAQLPIKNFFTRLVQLSNLMLAAQPGSPQQQQCAAFQQQFNASPAGASILSSSVFAKIKPILQVMGIGLGI